MGTDMETDIGTVDITDTGMDTEGRVRQLVY